MKEERHQASTAITNFLPPPEAGGGRAAELRGLISEVAARHPRIHWVEDREPWERGGILIMHELCPPPHTHQITHRAEPGGSRSYRELNIMQSGASQDIDCFLFSSVEASKTETKNEDLLELRRLCLRCRLDHDRKKRPWVSKLPALWLQVFLLSLKKKKTSHYTRENGLREMGGGFNSISWQIHCRM